MYAHTYTTFYTSVVIAKVLLEYVSEGFATELPRISNRHSVAEIPPINKLLSRRVPIFSVQPAMKLNRPGRCGNSFYQSHVTHIMDSAQNLFLGITLRRVMYLVGHN